MNDRFRPARLTDEQRLDWLRLIRTDHIGPRTFRTLINRFRGAARAIEHLPELARRGGGGAVVPARQTIEKEIAAAKKIGVQFIGLGEAEYPERLRETEDAPPLLAVRGTVEALNAPAVAIVGSRNASAAGARFSTLLARDLGEAGFAVISGLARGIDAAAHRGALATCTIAVLPGGHDKPYPPDNAKLLAEILETGCAISEMPMGWEPRAHDFPRRNRIIAGMSLGVVVVEAAERSGSLITARLALEAGREVFAVPGSPLDARSSGTNRLIKDGATLAASAADVIETLRPIMGDITQPLTLEPQATTEDPEPVEPDDKLRARILALLGPSPVSIDDLVREAAAPPGAVQTVLLELELAGKLERRSGLISRV